MPLTWDDGAWAEYLEWQQTDRRILKRINQLVKDIQRNDHEGIGKPEPLKHQLSGSWSRRITDEHRLVYVIRGNTVHIISCRYHYGK